MIVLAVLLQPDNRRRPEETTMAISLTEDIKTVEDLVNDPRGLLKQARRNGRPVVIAEGGKPAVVMLKAERYEWLVHLVNLNKLLNEGVEDVLAGRVKPAEQVFRELGLGRKKKKVSR
jgi:prevent-host-death family protein